MSRAAFWTFGLSTFALFQCGCSIPALQAILGLTPQDNDNGTPTTAVAAAAPATATNVTLGAPGLIRWADVADQAGTVISVTAQRKNDLDENIGDPIALVTDRDALVDGEGDIFNWDVTGVRAGMYEIVVQISAPDGTTAMDTADGRFTVTTALPLPVLTFTAPGATDVTFNPGDTFNMTWTDNGTSNADAKVTLGLDLDFEHDEGDEIILLADQPLSTDGNTGTFAFTGADANGNPIAANTYSVFAIVDDGVHDPVISEATGQLIIAP